MKRALALLPVLLLAGCNPEAGGLQRADTGNPEVVSVLLGNVDGCRLWRVYDKSQSRSVYVSVCASGRSSAEWTEGCGKGCTRHVQALTPAVEVRR